MVFSLTKILSVLAKAPNGGDRHSHTPPAAGGLLAGNLALTITSIEKVNTL